MVPNPGRSFRGRVTTASTTTAVITIAMNPVSACTGETAPQIGPDVCATSFRKRTNPMLNRLLPSRFVIASSGAPIRSAANDVASSGRDVAAARNCVPMKLFCHPISTARSSLTNESHTAAPTTTSAVAAYIPM